MMSISEEQSNLRKTDILQLDLDSLTYWSSALLAAYHFKFNPSKCKVMHIGHKVDMKYPYHLKNDLGEQWIDGTLESRLKTI